MQDDRPAKAAPLHAELSRSESGGRRREAGLLRRVLRAQKFPYVLVVACAMVAWVAKHAVDRATTAPLLSYSCSEGSAPGRSVGSAAQDISCNGAAFQSPSSPTEGVVSCEIRNVSVDKTHRDLEFDISALRGALSSPEVRWSEPLHASADDKAPCVTESRSFARYRLAVLGPAAGLRLSARITSGAEYRLLVPARSGVVLLPSSSWTVWLVRNEAGILWAVVAAALALLGASLVAWATDRSPGDEGGDS